MHVTVKVWKDSVIFQDKLRRLKGESIFFAPPEAIKCSNIVNVIGFCCDGDHIGAVYNLNSVSTLENYLAQGVDKFQWRERMIVALGIARLYCFLQHFESTHSIHWALPSCVILDQDKKPFLYDFSMLKGEIFPGKKAASNYKLQGFVDYSEPYHLWTGLIIPKLDIFAFGVLLMSLICKCEMGKKIGDLIYTFVEEDCKSKISISAHESFVNHASFDQYDSHKLSVLAMQCVGLVHWATRPTASDIVKQLSHLLLFPGTRISADFDVDVDVDNDVEAIRKPSQTKYRHIFEKLMSCASGKRMRGKTKKGYKAPCKPSKCDQDEKSYS